MKFSKNWKKFLQEEVEANRVFSSVLDEIEKFEEATAAKKRGIALPTMLEKLKKYSVPAEQVPTHYMHFSDINKIGIKPKSGFDTPLGIYFYPVNEIILRQLEEGKIPYASERKFLHVVKPKPDAEILYNRNFTEEDFDDKLMKLFSSSTGEKLTKKTARKTPEGETVGYLEQAPYMYEEFEKFKKKIEKGHVEEDLNAVDDLRRLLSKKDDEYFLESQTADPILKDAFEEIKKYFKYPGPYSRLDYFSNVIRQVATYTVKGQFDATQQYVDAIHKKLGYDPEVDSIRTLQRASEKYPAGVIKEPGFNLNHAKAVMYAWDFLKQKSQEALKKNPDYPSLGISDAIGTGNRWGYFTAEQWKKHLGIGEGKPAIVQTIKMSPGIQLTSQRANIQTPLGKLWNITRNYFKQSTSNMKEWARTLRVLGVDGISDYTGEGLIHSAEPMQAVFFTKNAIEQVESFDNKMTTGHVLKRKATQYLREALPYIKKAFSDHLGRDPEKQEIVDMADRISRDIRNLDNPPSEGVATYIQNKYNSGKLGGYNTKLLIAQVVYEIKSEALIEIFGKLKTSLQRLSTSNDHFDPQAGEVWDRTQAKINFEYRNEGLSLGNAENSLKGLQQWLVASKNIWDQIIKRQLKIEFPFTKL